MPPTQVFIPECRLGEAKDPEETTDPGDTTDLKKQPNQEKQTTYEAQQISIPCRILNCLKDILLDGMPQCPSCHHRNQNPIVMAKVVLLISWKQLGNCWQLAVTYVAVHRRLFPAQLAVPAVGRKRSEHPCKKKKILLVVVRVTPR